MFAELRKDEGKKPSQFRSLAELVLPIPVLRDAVYTELLPDVSHALSTQCMERVAMPMNAVTVETNEVIDTVVGQLTSPPEISNRHHITTAEDAALHEIERFRAFALETIERSIGNLISSMAQEVLGRELRLAPVDLDEITDRALRRYDREGPVRVRVSAADLGSVKTELPVVVDTNLRDGDLIVEVRDGMLDARMNVRLDCMTRRFMQSLLEHYPS